MLKNRIKRWLENYPNVYVGRLSKKNLFRSLTSNSRILPDFIIIGESNCGTTSLYNYMIQHPAIKPALSKEINFFNWSYDKPQNWYSAHFPTKFKKKISKNICKKPFLTGEATPLYLFNSQVPKRMFETIPNVKIIIVLRNPVDRAYSHYHDLGVRLGGEKRTFDDAIRSELKILEEKNYVTTDYDGNFTDRLYQYVVRGIYLDHLKIWMDMFPVKQFLILKTEELEKNPSEILNSVFKFLSLHNYDKINFEEKHNVSKYEPMNEQSRKILKQFFKPHNERLYKFLKRDFEWDC